MAFSKEILKNILKTNQDEIERYQVVKRDFDLDSFQYYVLIGIRRAGKSFLLYQKIQQMLSEGVKWNKMLYLNFEDERLDGFDTEDFNSILECHAEMYGERPTLFLDEIQCINGWEKFARRLADSKYNVYITGSNAKMLSQEVMTTLGGRYLTVEVYPFSLCEYLKKKGVPYDKLSLMSTNGKALMKRTFNEYFQWGGMPESADLAIKRNYLSSVYQKIYLGDIATRNNISNPNMLRLMLKKLAESVRQPMSYNRVSKILSSVSGKISVPTVQNYISYAEDAWLLLRLRNITSSFAEKETTCKYYFVDNGLLSLFLIDSNPALLENLVAISLFRKYGHDLSNDTVYFYNDNVEVDFYVPEEALAIQVSYSIADDETFRREVTALTKLPNVQPCKHRIIITYDEENTITDSVGTIEVIPVWKFLLCSSPESESAQ